MNSCRERLTGLDAGLFGNAAHDHGKEGYNGSSRNVLQLLAPHGRLCRSAVFTAGVPRHMGLGGETQARRLGEAVAPRKPARNGLASSASPTNPGIKLDKATLSFPTDIPLQSLLGTEGASVGECSGLESL